MKILLKFGHAFFKIVLASLKEKRKEEEKNIWQTVNIWLGNNSLQKSPILFSLKVRQKCQFTKAPLENFSMFLICVKHTSILLR